MKLFIDKFWPRQLFVTTRDWHRAVLGHAAGFLQGSDTADTAAALVGASGQTAAAADTHNWAHHIHDMQSY